MKVIYNTEEIEIKDGTSVYQLVSQMEDIEHKAVWINGVHLTYDEFERKVKEGDAIRTRRIIGGG